MSPDAVRNGDATTGLRRQQPGSGQRVHNHDRDPFLGPTLPLFPRGPQTGNPRAARSADAQDLGGGDARFRGLQADQVDAGAGEMESTHLGSSALGAENRGVFSAPKRIPGHRSQEEHLRRVFGDPYIEFCSKVPRFLGRSRPNS